MTNFDEQIAAIKLFNEKALKLQNSSFVRDLQLPNAGVKIKGERQDDGNFAISSERKGPSDESIEAFVLTFRFFIQDNEESSLRNIASIYHGTDFENDLTGRFDSARNAINHLLASPNPLNITYNETVPTNRQVMEVFIYGGLAHANPEKYALYKEWMSFPPVARMLETCFTLVLGQILNAISFIANVNEEAIQQLKNRKPDSSSAA